MSLLLVQPNTDFMNKHGDYVLGLQAETFLLMKREFNVTWRNKFGLYIRLSQVCVFSSYHQHPQIH